MIPAGNQFPGKRPWIYVRELTPLARRAVDRLMPGPVTLVFLASELFSRELTAGTGKVAIRVPEHAVAAGLARAFGGPVTATSANLSGLPGLTSPDDVASALGGGIDLILDGGCTPGGPPSTIVDVTSDPPGLLREGNVKKSRIERLLGVPVS